LESVPDPADGDGSPARIDRAPDVADRFEQERRLGKRRDLPGLTRALARWLLEHADFQTGALPPWWSLSAIAGSFGYSRRAVAKHLNVLESAGDLTRHRDLRAAVQDHIPTSYSVHIQASAPDALGLVHEVHTDIPSNKPSSKDKDQDQNLFPSGARQRARARTHTREGNEKKITEEKEDQDHAVGAASARVQALQALVRDVSEQWAMPGTSQ